MATVRTMVLDEEDRLEVLDLRTREQAFELFISSGSDSAKESHVNKYVEILKDINEFKRRILEEEGEITESMYDYTFFFDTVSGYLMIEDAE